MIWKYLHKVLSQGIFGGANLQLWAVSEMSLALPILLLEKLQWNKLRTSQLWLTLSSPFQLTVAATSSSSLNLFSARSAFSVSLTWSSVTYAHHCLYAVLTFISPSTAPYRKGWSITPGGSLLVALLYLAPTSNPPVFLPCFPSREQKISLPSQCKLLFTAKSMLLNLMAFSSLALKEVKQSLYLSFIPNQSYISLTMTIELKR